jgi:hypothetical protein
LPSNRQFQVEKKTMNVTVTAVVFVLVVVVVVVIIKTQTTLGVHFIIVLTQLICSTSYPALALL